MKNNIRRSAFLWGFSCIFIWISSIALSIYLNTKVDEIHGVNSYEYFYDKINLIAVVTVVICILFLILSKFIDLNEKHYLSMKIIFLILFLFGVVSLFVSFYPLTRGMIQKVSRVQAGSEIMKATTTVLK